MKTPSGNPRKASKSSNSATPLAIEYRDVGDLHPDPNNPRIHAEKQLKQIAESVKTFGFNVPILATPSRQLIAGHGRLEAAKLLGMKKVPVIALDHLTAEQRAAFMIADNRLTENADWDEQLLGRQLKLLADASLELSLEVTGFEVGEIDAFIEGAALGDGDQDFADARRGERISRSDDSRRLRRPLTWRQSDPPLVHRAGGFRNQCQRSQLVGTRSHHARTFLTR